MKQTGHHYIVEQDIYDWLIKSFSKNLSFKHIDYFHFKLWYETAPLPVLSIQSIQFS